MKNYTLLADPGSLEIRLVRDFDAPPELLFRACTTAEAIPQWWGPSYLSTHVDQLEARPGGAWRYVQKDAEGNEYAFRGFFHQVDPARRLVYTFEWEGMPGHILLETIDFEPLTNGRCRMVDSSVFQSLADRDGMMASGMEDGAAESTERLAAWLSAARR